MARVKKPNLHDTPVPVTNDGLVNIASGLGTAKAKRSHNMFAYSRFGDWQHLDNAYQTNWLARQIVDVPAEDMCREWRTLKTDDADAIRAEEDRLMIPVMVQEAATWSGLYGGAGMLMLTGQPLDKPLNINRVRKGDLRRVIVFDRYDMSAMQMNTYNVLADNFLLPEYYTITGGGQQIHWSHFARFNGTRLPRRQMQQTQGWGDSDLRKCLDDIMDLVAAKDGIAELMQEANVDIIKRAGLNEELASDQDEAITQRYALFSQMKSVIQMALLDGDEDYDRKTLNLGGVAPVIETFMTWISGAADIPVTRLFGTSAKGMNATGEGDMNNYFNSIRSKQLVRLDPGMRTLDEVMVRSALGYWPDDFNYVWNPLQQPNELQSAQAAYARAQKDVMYLDAGIVRPSQIQRNLQSSEEYQYDATEIDEADKSELEVQSPALDTGEFMERYMQLIERNMSHDEAMQQLAP